MDEKFIRLRDEFEAQLGIHLSDIETPYNLIERRICNSVKLTMLTREQWELILSKKYDYLFQSGVPHLSWNTDRGEMFAKLIDQTEAVCKRRHEGTWYTDYITYVITKTGVAFKLTESIPNDFFRSSTRTQRKIEIIEQDQIPPKNNTVGILIEIDSYGHATIVSQKTGSPDEIPDWIANKAKEFSGTIYTKIVVLK